MKEKKKEFDENKITGFFDKETKIKGDLSFKGAFHIDGHFKGKIDSESVLIVGDNGKVEADIKIGHLIVNGEIKGNIQAKERVEVNSTGRIIGTVITPVLVVEEGAYLESTCQTTDKVPEPMPEKKPDVDEVPPSVPEDEINSEYQP